MLIETGHDRRRFTRVATTRRCKVWEPRRRRYYAGTTRDLSAGGLLVRLDLPIPLEPGDRLFVAVESKLDRRILRQEDFIPARVARVVGSGDATWIGLEVADLAPAFAAPSERRAA